MRRNASESFVATVLAMGLSVVTGILIAKALGPSGKGVWAATQLIVGVVLSFSGGTGTAVTYLLTKARRTLDDVLPVIGIVAMGLTLAAWIALLAWGARGGTFAVVAIGCIVLPASVLLSWQQSYYTAEGGLRSYNLQRVALNLATCAAVAVALFAFHATIVGAMAAWCACTYAASVYFAIDLARSRSGNRTAPIGDVARTFVKFGGQSALNVLLGMLNYRIDLFIIVGTLGYATLGIYSVAVSLGELLFMMSRSVTMAITRRLGTDSLQESAQLCARAIRMSTAATFACAVVMWFVGPPAIALIYGNAFAPAAAPLHILLPGIVAFASSGTFVAFFLFQLGRPSIVTWWNAGMLCVEAIACIALIPRYGMNGAAAASTVSYLIGAAFNTWYFRRVTGIGPLQLWLLTPGDVASAVARPTPPQTAHERCTVVVTGAAGSVATLLRPHLRARFDLRLLDARPVRDAATHESFQRMDFTDLRKLRAAVRGADAVLHLGAVSKEADFDALLQSNINGIRNVLEAARLEGVRRVVVASSGHVTGFYRKGDRVSADSRVRPDTMYAASKAWAEALASYYADAHGIEVLIIRIGWVTPTPEKDIARSIWVSPRDLAQLVRIGVEHPDVRNDVVFGVSNNAASWWDDARAADLGYRPLDSADAFDIAALPRTAGETPYQGDDFITARPLPT